MGPKIDDISSLNKAAISAGDIGNSIDGVGSANSGWDIMFENCIGDDVWHLIWGDI